MGFRFRRSVRLLPGLRVNIGKGGITSVSVGRRGLTANTNAEGQRTTFGLPGTGISYSTARSRSRRPVGARILGLVVALVIAAAIVGAFAQ